MTHPGRASHGELFLACVVHGLAAEQITVPIAILSHIPLPRGQGQSLDPNASRGVFPLLQ